MNIVDSFFICVSSDFKSIVILSKWMPMWIIPSQRQPLLPAINRFFFSFLYFHCILKLHFTSCVSTLNYFMLLSCIATIFAIFSLSLSLSLTFSSNFLFLFVVNIKNTAKAAEESFAWHANFHGCRSVNVHRCMMKLNKTRRQQQQQKTNNTGKMKALRQQNGIFSCTKRWW